MGDYFDPAKQSNGPSQHGQSQGDAYEPMNVSNVPDAPPPPGAGGAAEGKDDDEEKKELVDKSEKKKKTGGGSSMSNVGSTVTKTQSKSKKVTKKGDKKKKGKNAKKPKKMKTAHFKKRGKPIFKILCLIFSAVSLVCLIGALVLGIMIAVNASS